jgi:ABC-type branched-subunit amino acid transport system substrate-binding protein/cytochrome c553
MRRRDLRDGAVTAKRSRRAAAALVVAGTAGLALSVLATVQTAAAADLTPAEERGRTIYAEGKSQSSRVITASLRQGEAPAPAAILPCASCHGSDGRGADDYSGIAPLNITWHALAAVGEHVHSKRRHAPFDEVSLARSIVEGVDPDGNDLDSSMPRYKMADEDMADLLAYLKVIDSQTDPGITSAAIRVGTVLPMDGKNAGLGRAMRETIAAYFSRVNAAGGVHGRKLELVVGPWGANDDPPIWQARDLVNDEPLFALVSGFVPQYDAEYEALANEKKIPLVGPYTATPPGHSGENTEDTANRFAFYTLAGLDLQVQALVRAVTGDPDTRDTRIAVVYPQVPSLAALANAASAHAEALGIEPVILSGYPYGQFDEQTVVATLRSSGAEAVVFLGSAAELVEFGRSAAQANWVPYLLSPGLLGESGVFELPKSFSGRVLLSYESLPTDYTPEASAEFEKLHEDFGFGYEYSVAQLAAYSAAKILVEGLERAGRDINRERLVDTLENLRGFRTGLGPPVSYGPERRIGALGAHIVRADLVAGGFDPATTWVSLDGAENN